MNTMIEAENQLFPVGVNVTGIKQSKTFVLPMENREEGTNNFLSHESIFTKCHCEHVINPFTLYYIKCKVCFIMEIVGFILPSIFWCKKL
jgi:hypothetical protein